MPGTPKTYRINLIRTLREKERKQERKRQMQAMMGAACFAVLALSIAYSGYTMWRMEGVLAAEKRKLDHVQAEYNKYTATRMIVEKADVELLNALQGRGIFWTKKLAALANHLPEDYTITKFSYHNGELRVSGLGTVSSRQDQLLVLDAYLNRLRADSAFASVFPQIHLNIAQNEEDATGRVAFEFSAMNPQAQVRR